MALTSVMTRQQAQPADLGARLMSRLYPTSYGGSTLPPSSLAPKSPTGLPIAVPPPPASPAPAGRGITPGYSPTASAPLSPAPPPATVTPYQPPTGLRQMYQPTAAPAAPAPDPAYAGLTPEDQAALGNFWNSVLKGIPDYKGSHEAQLFLQGLYSNMLRQRENNPIDFSGEGQIGQYYDRARSRQAAMDAAMGRSGGGVGAAGQGALFAAEGGDIGNYVRAIVEQRRREKLAQDQWMNQLVAEVGMQGLGANRAEQMNKNGWLKDALGIAGTIGGAIIGGPPGAAIGGSIGKGVGGAVGGNSYTPMSPGQYGYEPGYGGIGPDVNGPFLPGSDYQTQLPWEKQYDVPAEWGLG